MKRLKVVLTVLALMLLLPAAASAEEATRDGVRARGGFSFNGGVLLMPEAPDALGGAISLSGRVGVQFNHIFSAYYQGTPTVGIIADSGSAAALAMVYNSIMAGFTLGHFLDLGVGPSIDIYAAGAADAAGGVGADSGVRPGANVRAAFNIGGLSGNGPRRSGFAIGFDFHPVFFERATLMSFTVGLGGEWY